MNEENSFGNCASSAARIHAVLDWIMKRKSIFEFIGDQERYRNQNQKNESLFLNVMKQENEERRNREEEI